MMWDEDYRGYRLAQLLSELLGGDKLISFTLHWRAEGQPRKTTCPLAPSSIDKSKMEASPLTFSQLT